MPRFICRKLFILLFVLALVPVFASAQASLVNINTAGLEELDTLPGIGPAYAERIVDYRNTNGPFQSIEEIQNVSGIGPSTFADLKDLITVGDVGASSGTSDGNVNQSTNQTSQNESTHYSATPVTSVSKTSSPSVGAGRDRIGAVGSPLEFKVETGGKSDSYRQSIFSWNFGDGVQGTGPLVTHVYDYPGEYVVVLSANFPEGEALARVNVKIVDPGIAVVSATPERIELKNNSQHEANLFGRVLVVGDHAFVFPRDTIIKAGRNLFFGSRVTGLKPFGTHDVQVVIVGETENSKIAAKVEEKKMERVAYLESQILALQQNLQKKMAVIPNLAVKPPSEELIVEEEFSTFEEPNPVPQTASARTGWFEVLKRFFLRANNER
ncbi:MAG: helix-hairpin-helix domain-containing protein [Candidatus Zambryskibacteria bacterium]|nr:helix-hairpin-helix domain-containing protein [Candidatus Zambryskibacteria bacterium]